MKNEFEQVKYGMIRFEQAIRVSSTIISQKDVNKLGAIIKNVAMKKTICSLVF